MNRQQAETAQWVCQVDKARSAAHRAGEAYAVARDALDQSTRANGGVGDGTDPVAAADAEREAYRAWRFAVSWLDELQCGE